MAFQGVAPDLLGHWQVPGFLFASFVGTAPGSRVRRAELRGSKMEGQFL